MLHSLINNCLKFCLLLSTLTAYASHSLLQSHQQQLEQVKNQIISLKKNISEDKNKKTNLEKQLKDTELSINTTQKKFHKIDMEIKNRYAKINELTQTQLNQQNLLDQQQSLLKQQILKAYVLGRKSYLQALLNQENLDDLQRMMVYYQYLNQHCLSSLEKINQLIEKIKQSKQQLLQENRQLNHVLQRSKKVQVALTQDKIKREQLFQAIDHRLNSRQAHLASLNHDEVTLTKLIHYLRQQERMQQETHFANSQGKLSWPTQGKIIAHFGTSIEHSELRWNGVLIQAPEAQPVYAIAAGKVVFADWLKGFGLLLIIDHGQDYLTLYGRNNSLYKKVGDEVEKNEYIAEVGKSGGFSQSSLYFEIRKHGYPLNPEQWCHTS